MKREDVPTVDVVTVWYNRGYRVEASIGSIITQDLARYRVFAVDDGSTDDTVSRLRAMVGPARERGVELIVWAKENEGFTRSLKRCIEEKTTAPLIGLHGAGDISHPRRLSTLVDLLAKSERYAAAGCGVQITSPEGTPIGLRTLDGAAPRDLQNGRVPKPATHECAIIRRSAYDAIGGYREFFRYAQDSDLWIRLSRVGEIVNTPEILFDKVAIQESVSADWRRSLLQRKYSTLALQAGIAVDNGEADPIPTIAAGRATRVDTARSTGDNAGPNRREADRSWERAVDPRILLSRFHFWKRIGASIRDGRLNDAAGLTKEVLTEYGRAFLWYVRRPAI